ACGQLIGARAGRRDEGAAMRPIRYYAPRAESGAAVERAGDGEDEIADVEPAVVVAVGGRAVDERHGAEHDGERADEILDRHDVVGRAVAGTERVLGRRRPRRG